MTLTVSQGVAGIADDAFATAPGVPNELTSQLGRSGFRGVLLEGPRQVRAERADLRLLAVHAASPADTARMSFSEKAIIIASRVEARVAAAEFAVDGDHPRTPVDHRAAEAAGTSRDRVLLTYSVPLAQRFPWIVRPGTVCAWIVTYDEASNPVLTRCVEREVGDPVVREFAARNRRPASASAGSVPPDADEPLHFLRLDDTPPVPAAPGITLAAERIFVGGPDATCTLRGAFRLPAAECERVAPAQPDDVGPSVEPRPTARLSITLILTGDTSSYPEVVRIVVPSFDAIAPTDERPVVTGQFTVDLARHACLEHQTYAVWAVHGDLLVGPTLVSWMNPRLLEPPA